MDHGIIRDRTAKAALSVAIAFILLAAAAIGVGSQGGAEACPSSFRRVKNIIVMIGDGMGFNHVKATNYYQAGRTGVQVYERFPIKLSMSTYEYELVNGVYTLLGYDPTRAWSEFDYVKENATDSASAATAMSTGIKTRNGAIGVDIADRPLYHLVQQAEELGMATGVVTSVQWSHATPAGFVAHNTSRNNYEEIAKEMIEISAVDVIMGCGHPCYDDSGNVRPTPSYRYVGGQKTWQNLLSGNAGTGVDADHNGMKDDAWSLVQTRAEFRALGSGPTPKRVCGTAQAHSTLQQSRSGDAQAAPFAVPLNAGVPTLAEMTRAAINVLDEDKDGFFLMIEGGAVDWASHANQSGRMIEEQMDFNAAVQAVVDWVNRKSNWHETILVVTGDHECGYLCGPGSKSAQKVLPLVNNGRGQMPGMEWNSGDHTNSLVPFYAKGWAALSLLRYADESDPVRGRYLDNAELGRALFDLLR